MSICVIPAEEDTAILTVRVTGLKPSQGQVLLSLFSSRETYLKKPVLEQKIVVGSQGDVQFFLKNIKLGTYAVSVIYDTDKNGKLNTGFMGIPTEKVGFSNNVKGRFGPPSFKKTSFDFSTSLNITINVDKARK